MPGLHLPLMKDQYPRADLLEVVFCQLCLVISSSLKEGTYGRNKFQLQELYTNFVSTLKIPLICTILVLKKD
jgi:hypothetical protein